MTRDLEVPRSRTTLRRLLRLLREPVVQQLRAVGVDEFALRRGTDHGTVLVDMDTGRPLDLLPDRTAETLSAWLRKHPSPRAEDFVGVPIASDGKPDRAKLAQAIEDEFAIVRLRLKPDAR